MCVRAWGPIDVVETVRARHSDSLGCFLLINFRFREPRDPTRVPIIKNRTQRGYVHAPTDPRSTTPGARRCSCCRGTHSSLSLDCTHQQSTHITATRPCPLVQRPYSSLRPLAQYTISLDVPSLPLARLVCFASLSFGGQAAVLSKPHLALISECLSVAAARARRAAASSAAALL